MILSETDVKPSASHLIRISSIDAYLSSKLCNKNARVFTSKTCNLRQLHGSSLTFHQFLSNPRIFPAVTSHNQTKHLLESKIASSGSSDRS